MEGGREGGKEGGKKGVREEQLFQTGLGNVFVF
jgi:hypothetical protein